MNTTKNLQLDLRTYDSDIQSHSHEYHQLVMPVRGNLDITVNHASGQVSPIQGAIIAAGSEHAFAATGQNQFLVADIPYHLAQQLERLPAFINLDTSLSHYVQFLHSQVQSKQHSNQQQMLLLLIQLLNERFCDDEINIDQRIANVKDYIEQHYATPLTLQQLAKVANLSQRQMSTLFKAQTGMTAQQYLLEKRMQTAWLLLCNTTQSVQQVADQVGYQNLTAFSDRFRKHFGKSPRHFRQHDKLFIQPTKVSRLPKN